MRGMAFLVAARSTVGEWLSLVEHLVRDQGVGGSNPLSPTIFETKQLRAEFRPGRNANPTVNQHRRFSFFAYSIFPIHNYRRFCYR
jgi:hypothetical protein